MTEEEIVSSFPVTPASNLQNECSDVISYKCGCHIVGMIRS